MKFIMIPTGTIVNIIDPRAIEIAQTSDCYKLYEDEKPAALAKPSRKK